MPAAAPANTSPPISAARALWGVMVFLRRRPGMVALSIGLLLVNITIELSLPQLLGNAINSLGQRSETPTGFSLGRTVALFVALVSLRTGVGFILNPAVETTLRWRRDWRSPSGLGPAG